MQEAVFQTAADSAYDIIFHKIMNGEYPPGTKLSRRKMAEVTDVSVIPVIEALKRLEETGLVESQPQWGSFVAVPTREKVVHTYQLREAVECQVARIMAQQLTPTQCEHLMAIATELDTVPYVESSVPNSRKNHLAFHHDLASFTGNDLLVKALDRANLFWVLCQALNAKASKEVYPRYWHRKLMDDIRSGDVERAEESMRLHVLDSLQPILDAMEENERTK